MQFYNFVYWKWKNSEHLAWATQCCAAGLCSLIPRLPLHANEKWKRKGLFRTASNRKLGRAWKWGYELCAISRQLPGPQSSTCTGRLVLMHTVCALKALSVHYRKFSSEHMPGGLVYRWLLADFSCWAAPRSQTQDTSDLSHQCSATEPWQPTLTIILLHR